MGTYVHCRSRARKPAGVALFLVLAFLALIITLVLAFLSSVTSELGTARSAASQITARQLADTSVQVVSSVIRMATTSPTDKSITWASQPGMIRTYGTAKGAASSAPLSCFKLYSSDDMEITQSEIAKFNTADDPQPDLVANWDRMPARFTDLNSPVADSAGTMHFPIIDPRAYSDGGSSLVDGFSYGDTAVLSDGTKLKMNLVNAGGSGANQHRVPMPVKWIYVLNDGTLTAPMGVDSSGKIANWAGAPTSKTPSAANPIVGRIAFWTDDETSKININTAAGDLNKLPDTVAGSFWDSPRAYSLLDDNFTKSHVATNEFQRYPGHPATISLSAVFPDLLREQIGTLAPRIAYGGSKGGTVADDAGGTDFLARKTDRLYGSVDELIFRPTVSGDRRDENLPGIVTPDALDKVKFFLTTSSRAPELNLFGQPRVSMWPVHTIDSSTFRTASDGMLAFCSTISPSLSPKKYYFTRGSSSGNTSTDRNADYAGNARNQKLYEYLRKLMDKPIPGFGGPANGFGTKYGTLNRDQILTEIFDYIRITNLQDETLVAAGGKPFTPTTRSTGSGQVAPIKITTPAGDTKGFGRMATISEAALQFYATEISVPTAKTRKMRAVLILESFCPAQGYAGLYPSYSHSVTGLEKLTVTIGTQTLNLNFPSTAVNKVSSSGGFHSRALSGTEGIANGFYQKIVPPKAGANYQLISQKDIDLSAAKVKTMKLNGATATLTIKCTDSAGTTVQTIKLKFPDIPGLPLPAAPGNFGAKFTSNGGIKKIDYNDRISQLSDNTNWGNLIDKNDVVHSLEPSGAPVNGDLRLVAASENVPDTVFLPHANYAKNSKMAHSLKTGINQPYDASTNGRLIAGMNYGNYQPPGNPDFPSSITTGALMTNPSKTPGDWDNGIANYIDGPYINKADEGTTTGVNGQAYWSYSSENTDGVTHFSPNRQMASPVMLGSLPTGVGYSPQRPWQTLLFRPDVSGTHPGSAAPKDYLVLDLFTMPIVEPYAISEPLSTAGKVNMNYQIAPFYYIKRETAVRAALKAILTMAIPDADSVKYKDRNSGTICRTPLDPVETLKQFQARFDNADPAKPSLFVSAAEICDLHLVPKGAVLTELQSPAYWDRFRLTGDNSREMPYNHLYPLLTTKSNTYTVHIRAQVLKKVRATAAKVWDEERDLVLSEYRGSSVIERYIDPDDSRFKPSSSNYVNPDTTSIEDIYRLRVLSTQKFSR